MLNLILSKMKVVTQVIPKEQVEIIKQGLDLLEIMLKNVKNHEENDKVSYTLFDILTLKGMLNQTEMVIELPFDIYERFTAINGVDFPQYS